MKRAPANLFFGLATVGLIVAVGCGGSGNDIKGTPLDNEGVDATSSLLSLSLGAEGCGINIPNLPDEFLAAMPNCGDGAGKCVPASPLMPASASKMLAPCEGGATCVPMAFLKANTQPLKECVSYGKAKGVCVSRVVPTVEKLTFLPQDTCAETERCAPCENPTDGKSTGICDIGKPPKKSADQCKSNEPAAPITCPHVGPPVLEISKLKACADEGMHCLPTGVVPAAFAPMLAKCEGQDALCAPDVSIAANGQFIPKTCTSAGGAEGRCLHKDIPQVAPQAKLLPQDTCAAYERCAPCFDPLSGDQLPTCKVSCDPGPQKPKVVFSKCAGDKGRCVSKANVPESMQSNLKEDTCKAGAELCAPVIAIDRNAKPKTCTLKILGFVQTGKPAVCVEDVLTIGGTLDKSDCDEGFKCTPCQNPLKNNEPTGLPGCPK
ncbi:MAG: hypothetical protein U0169_20225 [Polyangiaceae bacterium]